MLPGISGSDVYSSPMPSTGSLKNVLQPHGGEGEEMVNEDHKE